MRCPQCNNDFALTWMRYIKAPFGRFVCPSCRTPLKGKHRWFYFPMAVLGVCILGVPFGLLFGIPGWIVGASLSGFPFDLMLEKKFLTLEVRKQ